MKLKVAAKGRTDLSRHVADIAKKARDVGPAPAEAMADKLRSGAASHLGGNLNMSGAGAVVIGTDGTSADRMVVSTGGAYALADKGRQSAPARIKGGRPMQTPWGPRASVRGSKWAGFGITARHGPAALKAGAAAALRAMTGTR